MSLQKVKKRDFSSLGLKEWLIGQLKAMDIGEPTEIQFQCINAVLSGKDVIGCSRTGTGKTLAFALPILQKLSEDPFGVFAVILTPTRELAFQIGDQFRVIGKPIKLRDCVIVGGVSMLQQSSTMASKPHVIVATPGRFADHIKSGALDVSIFNRMKFLVLDEADRLLDGQYEHDLKTIFEALPTNRQTLLFSATINDALTRLNEVSIKKPFFWEDKETEDDVLTVATLTQQYVLCPVDFKDAYLVYVVKEFLEKNPTKSILVFCYTCRECQALTIMFRKLKLDVSVSSLHSMIPQKQRLFAMSQFRSSRLKVLLCTDVAARGLDIPVVDLVINHNVPRVAKEYVHRVGRAARAGRSGSAISFVTQYDVELLKAIEQHVNLKFDEIKVDDKEVGKFVAEVLLARREAEIDLDEQNFGEKKEIYKRTDMIAAGLDPEEADLAIARGKERRKDASQRRFAKANEKFGAIKKKKAKLAGPKKGFKSETSLSKKGKKDKF